MVRILCASDTHGIADVGKLATSAIRRKADVLVLAGDIEPAYKRISPEGYFCGVFMDAVRKLMHHCIEVVVVPGNHDFFLNRIMTDDPKKRIIWNLHILVDRSETVCGLKFYGTPWVPFINGRWCWERDDNLLDEKFDIIPSGIDVLVCHTPPEGVCEEETFDVSRQRNRMYWQHFGSKSLRDSILRCRPRCVVCGHIHSGDHKLNSVGESALINCSLIDDRYNEAYEPSEIEVVVCEDGSRKMRFKTEGAKKWETINQIGGAYDV